MPEISRAAWHEAGHAVWFIVSGVKVLAVDISGSLGKTLAVDDETVLVSGKTIIVPPDDPADLVLGICGGYCNEHCNDLSPSWRNISVVDTKLLLIHIGAFKCVENIEHWRKQRAQIRRRWAINSAIQDVASRLQETGFLFGEEVVEIVKRHYLA